MNTNQSWGGRFAKGPAEIVAQYTDSQSYDRALYAEDIRASQAHARMLGRQKILDPAEAETIIQGLEQVKTEIENNQFQWDPALEDVHMNIEARLTQIVGEVGKKLHTGRSRNDQVGLTFRLYVANACSEWQKKICSLINVLVQRATAEIDTILPGCTHLQPAQPISLAHHLLAYAWMLKRDHQRLNDALARTKTSPLGAAALAGTTYPLDPQFVAQEVGFNGIYANSLDAVADRDFVIETQACAAIIMMHLSRFCEELILWANPNFGYLKLPDTYATGSSIMPQKKNPDVAELMRGKTGRVYGALNSILTIMKGLPLAYNRDMQEDKEGFLDTQKTIEASLDVLTGMLSEVVFCRERMAKACKLGFLNATELADYLVSKGIPFREAHHLTGQCVAMAEQKGLGLEDLDLASLKTIAQEIQADVYPILDFKRAIERRETPGGTGPKSVAKQIEQLNLWLNQTLQKV